MFQSSPGLTMKHFTFCLLILALITTGFTQKVFDWKPKSWIFVRCTTSITNATTNELESKNVTIAMHADDLTNEELIQMYDKQKCEKVNKPKSKNPKPTRRPTRPTKAPTNTTTKASLK